MADQCSNLDASKWMSISKDNSFEQHPCPQHFILICTDLHNNLSDYEDRFKHKIIFLIKVNRNHRAKPMPTPVFFRKSMSSLHST